MRIRKFIASNLKEGKAKILDELGDDAIILSTRSIRKFDNENELIEIIAAIDDTPIKASGSKLKLPERDSFRKIDEERSGGTTETDFYKALSQIYSEINTLKSMIGEVSENVKFKYSGVLGPALGNLYKALRKADINESLALNITGKLSAEGKAKILEDIVPNARDILTRNIDIIESHTDSRRRIQLFTGPTGAGKTLSLIKLAVVTKLLSNSRVYIISTDTTKVGGFEQLQTYASLATIPFRAVYSPEELESLLQVETSFDQIFIDTVGKSPTEPDYIPELVSIAEASKPDDIHLVINAASSENNLKQVFAIYRDLKATDIIITKLDEVSVYGALIAALSKSQIPVSYLCSGQRIPEDIEPASKEKLADLVLPMNLNLLENTDV